jgi:hypothetical protein
MSLFKVKGKKEMEAVCPLHLLGKSGVSLESGHSGPRNKLPKKIVVMNCWRM